jgi:hypothetical protein
MSSKTTEIHVRAFNTDFVIELEKDYFISIEQAIAWAIVEMIDTAIVLKVVQKWTEGDLVIFNEKLPGLISKELTDKIHYRGVVKPVTHEQMQELFNKPKITHQTHA